MAACRLMCCAYSVPTSPVCDRRQATHCEPSSSRHLNGPLSGWGSPLTFEKVLFWLEALESAARFRVVAIGEAANLNGATIPVARHATVRFICFLPGTSRLAVLRRFCAVAAIRNSSWAPLGPRSRRRSSFRMRLRWAKSISTFFRSRQDWWYSGVFAIRLVFSRAASWMLRAILRNGVFGQQRSRQSSLHASSNSRRGLRGSSLPGSP